jgi:glycosyltransferase involved in cell wall biosynthesis
VRVMIDVSYSGRGRTGTGVYVEELARALDAREDTEVVRVRQRRRLRPGAGNPLRSAANLALDSAWTRFGLPRAARLARVDVLHHPLPAHSPRARCPQVVTVHDVAYERHPEEFDAAWRAVARRGHRGAVARTGAVVCPSHATARDAQELLGADPARTVVAHHGPGQELPAAGPAERRHLLYLGSDEPRKRVASLVEAHAALDEPPELVLAGEAARRALRPGVRGEPDPGPERVAELLAGALALVHPAPLEGFGLTLLEAMATATPVVALRSPSSEEVCGEAALLVEAGDLAGALERVSSDAELRARLSAAGRERAASFSWERSAEHHLEAYRLAVAR